MEKHLITLLINEADCKTPGAQARPSIFVPIFWKNRLEEGMLAYPLQLIQFTCSYV
jgi:hypothetical protein